MSLMDLLLSEPSAQDKYAQVMQTQSAGPADPRGLAELPLTGRPPGGVVQAARSQLGVDYTFGADDPGRTLDCSALTAYAARQLGIDLPHSAAQQSQMLPRVNSDQLQRGDLVFFDYGRLGGAADHVGIYTGNGHMIAASSAEDEVVRQPVDWSHFLWGGRLG